MRLVAVQTGLSPDSVLGGTITDREFLTRIADRGVEVHVLAEGNGEPVVEHPGFVVHRWRRRLRKPLPYVGNLDVALDLRSLLARVGTVDWIRFNSPYAVGLGALASRTGHRLWGSYLHVEDRPVWRALDRWLPARCDLITCLSPDTRRDLVARCPQVDDDRTVVIPMGIDTERFSRGERARREMRAQLGVADDEVLILFVGVLIPRKGIADLVATWRSLGDVPRLRLLLLSKPIEARETDLVRELVARDARVTHLEGVRYERIPDFFRAADVFFFPSHLEGYGIVVGEAMAAGLPVVTTRARGIRSVVTEGETALVSDVGDVAGHAHHIRSLVGDATLRRRLGEAGRRHIAEHFGWDAIIDRLMDALERPLRTPAARITA